MLRFVFIYDARFADAQWVEFGLCFKVGFVPSVDPDNRSIERLNFNL